MHRVGDEELGICVVEVEAVNYVGVDRDGSDCGAGEDGCAMRQGLRN